MSRGGSFGGGQSSLGYLFSSDENSKPNPPPVSPTTVTLPPYGIDTVDDHQSPPKNHRSSPETRHDIISNNYQRSDGQNSGNFITGRPSTKVSSAPGGDSSLGYLFGDK